MDVETDVGDGVQGRAEPEKVGRASGFEPLSSWSRTSWSHELVGEGDWEGQVGVCLPILIGLRYPEGILMPGGSLDLK